MRTWMTILASLPLLGAGCDLGSASQPPPTGPQSTAGPKDTLTPGAPPSTAGGMDNTFDHEEATTDPFAMLQRRQQEGPPEISSRLHSCQKLKVATLGHLLDSRGVNLQAQGMNGLPSAGQLYSAGMQALGAPNYGARVAETVEPSSAGATKLLDIFIQAAPEIIANMAAQPACQLRGGPVSLFDAQGGCSQDGITCLIGYPASADHVALCNDFIKRASTPALGQQLAVAALLGATQFCE